MIQCSMMKFRKYIFVTSENVLNSVLINYDQLGQCYMYLCLIYSGEMLNVDLKGIAVMNTFDRKYLLNLEDLVKKKI